jgi:hypothetical protein
MSVSTSENGNTPSSDVSTPPEPVYQLLDILPYELVQVVVSQVTNIEDLRSLARVNQLFQELAEPHIYRHILIRQGVQARRLANALRSKPIRATWVRSLQNACLSNAFNGLPELPDLVPLMTRLENLLVETPDCNSFSPEARLPWITQQKAYNRIFLKACQPNASLLPNLLSCTLHFVDDNRSLYFLGHYSIIFLHPTLVDLTISCANIDPPRKLHPLLLQPDITNTTPLQSLHLVECDFHPQGLYHLIRLPRQLASLTITEATHYVFYTNDRRYSGLNTSDILHPVANVQPHLAHLRIARLCLGDYYLFSLPPLDLTPFTNLTSVEYANIQGPGIIRPPFPDHCDLVHRVGPQFNTGAPNTTTLTYSDIPPQYWDRGVQFFKCAFRNRTSHGIESLRLLKWVLIDEDLLFGQPAEADEIGIFEQENRRALVERVRRGVRELGELGRKSGVGVRVLVEWVRPNGSTIPPYLLGEYVPERRFEYDSGIAAA